jgi:hypothetical protein
LDGVFNVVVGQHIGPLKRRDSSTGVLMGVIITSR